MTHTPKRLDVWARVKQPCKLLCLATLLLFGTGCATQATGVGQPTSAITYRRHFVSNDPRLPLHVETLATASIDNPSDKDLTLDCTVSRTTVKAHSHLDVLLDPADQHCELS